MAFSYGDEFTVVIGVEDVFKCLRVSFFPSPKKKAIFSLHANYTKWHRLACKLAQTSKSQACVHLHELACTCMGLHAPEYACCMHQNALVACSRTRSVLHTTRTNLHCIRINLHTSACKPFCNLHALASLASSLPLA